LFVQTSDPLALIWPGKHEQHPHTAVQPVLHNGGAAQPAFAQTGALPPQAGISTATVSAAAAMQLR
jgi:hypothetical protein